MNRNTNRQRAFLAVAATALLGLSALAMAETQLTFKSGQTWRGDVDQTVEVVFNEGGKDQTLEGKLVRADKTLVIVEATVFGKLSKKTIFFGDIKSMKTVGVAAKPDASATPAATPNATPAGTPAGTPTPAAPNASATPPGAKKALPLNYKGVFFLPLEGGVGEGVRHNEIEKIGIEADKFGPGQIIILEITSPGGAVTEMDKIGPTIREIRKRHRVIAWIKEAISAASFTALHCNEIYFMKEGAMGSMTMWAGGISIQGPRLEAWLESAAQITAESGRDPQIVRCMITKRFELSYDIPEGGGPKDAIFRPDTKGAVVLDTAETMLTLNASQAFACGISDGTADTPDELAKLLNLPEWKEVNGYGRKLHHDWHRLLDTGKEEIPKLVFLMGVKGTDPIAQLNGVIQSVTKLIEWWQKCPECMIAAAGKGVPIQDEDGYKQMLKEFRDRLAAMKKQDRANKSGN